MREFFSVWKTIGDDAWYGVGHGYPKQSDSDTCGVHLLASIKSLALGITPDKAQHLPEEMENFRYCVAAELRKGQLDLPLPQ